jgi:hypothetical protein
MEEWWVGNVSYLLRIGSLDIIDVVFYLSYSLALAVLCSSKMYEFRPRLAIEH